MGEFEKHIEEHMVELSHGDMASGAKGDDFDYMPLIHIREMLVEAKKEFPLDVSYDHRYIKESLAWFEKWFGDGAEK